MWRWEHMAEAGAATVRFYEGDYTARPPTSEVSASEECLDVSLTVLVDPLLGKRPG